MSRDWHEESGSFERFHTDRGVKKKQKRGDRHAQKQKMREAASDIDRYEDDSFEDEVDGRSTKQS
jgi:hypothetical protein